MSEEKRGHRRFPIQLGCELGLGGRSVPAATRNLSRGGVALALSRPLEEGQPVRLTLFLLEDGIEDPNEEPFELAAQVQWTAEGDDPTLFLAGLNFMGLEPAQQERLEHFLGRLDE
ncbi:MAG: PilZ domain-containing protein [Myxococcales bacterium]|nr:PilZ domain-containing protein [Myxococcales bacterium]